MTIPSFPKLLALLVTLLVPLSGPAFACVCADGTSSVQSETRFCDGVAGESDTGTEPVCDAGCVSMQLLNPSGSGDEQADAASGVPPVDAVLAPPATTSRFISPRAPSPANSPPPGPAGCLRSVILIV